MKAIVINKPLDMEIKNLPRPTIRDGEVLVKIMKTTICGSDIKMYTGRMSGVNYPLLPGHEWSGCIEEAARGYEHLIGKRIIGDNINPCYICDYCRQGKYNYCKDLTEIGLTLPGSFAEYMVLNAKNVFPLKDTTSYRDACLIEPLAVVLNAFRKIQIKPNSRIAVYGLGAIGNLVIQICRLLGANNIVGVDPVPERLMAAKTAGANDVFPYGGKDGSLAKVAQFNPNLAFFCSNEAAPFSEIINCVQADSEVLVIGYTFDEMVSICLSEIVVKAITIRGVLSPVEWSQALTVIEDKRINCDLILTHTFPLEKYMEAFMMMKEKRAGIIKACFSLE